MALKAKISKVLILCACGLSVGVFVGRATSGPASPPVDDDQKMRDRGRGDVVAEKAPALTGWSKKEQLRRLKWTLRAPGKAHSLFPDLRGNGQSPTDRDAIAAERIQGLIAGLERDGHRVDELPSDFKAARFAPDEKGTAVEDIPVLEPAAASSPP